jgi:hypothetical protein
MAWRLLQFGASDVWQECRNNHVDGDNGGNIWCWIEHGECLLLQNSDVDPAAPRDRAFVLFSPQLTNQVISRTLTVRKEHRLPCGFLVDSARLHQKVFVVGEFSDEELAPLVQAEIDVVRVVGGTPKEISDNLAALLL